MNKNEPAKLGRAKCSRVAPSNLARNLSGLVAVVALAATVHASENVPRRPFAYWADIPEQGQLVFGIVYEQSESYYVWAGNQRHNVTIQTPDGESYGIDIRQGYFSLDYGLTKRWAADLELGGTTVGWRSFDPGGNVQETTGVMDLTAGARYQIWNEATADPAWLPTLTFRAAGILPGFYDRHLAFAPGNSSAAIEPSLLLRKPLGWAGLGLWGDALYRWEHTIGTDQYIVAAGLFEKLGPWELDVGYRHFQTTSGSDIVLIPPASGSPPPWDGITYKSNVREISDSIDAGFSYTTRRNIRWAFHARKTFDGSNTDSKLWLGGSVDIPFDNLFGTGKHHE
jgi:hypothetical protein